MTGGPVRDYFANLPMPRLGPPALCPTPRFEQRYVQVVPAAPFVFDYVFRPSGHRLHLGFPVGEHADDAGSPTDLAFEVFADVARPDLGPMLHR